MLGPHSLIQKSVYCARKNQSDPFIAIILATIHTRGLCSFLPLPYLCLSCIRTHINDFHYIKCIALEIVCYVITKGTAVIIMNKCVPRRVHSVHIMRAIEWRTTTSWG